MGSDRVMLSLADHEVLLVPAQFPTIQGAIDAVTRPATVVVEPGAIGPVGAVRRYAGDHAHGPLAHAVDVADQFHA